MIKFEKEVHAALKKLEKEGFETYAAGECVKSMMLGQPTYDWDLLTKAGIDDMERIFPEGKRLKEEEVLRLDFTAGDEEGVIIDIHTVTGTVEEALASHYFAIEAMADNPERGFVDPFKGKEDLDKQLIHMTAEPTEIFAKDPMAMMQAVRLAAETGFDLNKSIFDGITAGWRVLLDSDIVPIREEFERIMVSAHAGKGLSMLAGTGLINVILGEDVVRKMSGGESKEFNELCKNIDKTQPVRLRRLGLVYALFNKKRGLAALERMQFDEESYTFLHDAVAEVINVHFLTQDVALKRYIYEVGMERYEYMHNLIKAQSIIFDQPTLRIEGRNYFLKTIKTNGEPIFIEDLVIDENDLIEAGIADTPEKARMLLGMVISQVHKKPMNNRREYLLNMAKKYSKNKLLTMLKNLDWYR